ncbi:hypothetical protein BUALT_Bualt13G0055800 [Buddleja alternifolia]|uniref:GIR1-like zinc ribbon domain-containing protein n=1 Tax=Buddleja alternifolia TaxID=168488 RepID=A0AAV6WVW0_9LAMI|nr:hypothetical protein BUALT_Bualt13G0055800 [Buddleja alternifolia]
MNETTNTSVVVNIYYKDCKKVGEEMNYNAESPKLELKLNLSPSRDHRQVMSPKGPISSTEISPRSSCVSREVSPDESPGFLTGPEVGSMMVVGCPRCLMYVMLVLEDDPKCPKCKSSVLLDFVHEERTKRLMK